MTLEPASAPTLLVVEDDPLMRSMLVKLIEGEGFRVIAYPDGESCVAELRRLLPDAALLDLGLPGMDGIEVLKH